MKNTRKVLAIIMAVAMCFSMFNATAYATDTEYLASVTTADNVTTNYTDWYGARNAARENVGSTLKLLTDYTYDNSDGCYNLTNGEFTLDLNGYTVEMGIIVENATITFIDSAEEKGAIINSGGNAIIYYNGTLILDESADFIGEYADNEPWIIRSFSEEEMIIGEDIIIPDGFVFMNYLDNTVIDTLPPEVRFYIVDESTLPPTSEYDLFVGGVGVNADNADDILGDGTASYNVEENVLYLDGLNITDGYDMDAETKVGIFAGQDLNIVLADGSDNTISTPSNELTYGICVTGNLYILGDGELSVFCDDIDGEYDYAESLGIFATNGVCVEGATVYARGGDINATDWAQSSGIYTYGDVSVDFEGTLIAEGGSVTANSSAYSDGITVYAYINDEYINISVYDGYLEAIGGDVTSDYQAMSTGIYGVSTGVYTYDKNSVLVARGGNATVSETDNGYEPVARSFGIGVHGGDASFYAGNITVTTGECVGFETFSVGVLASADEEDDGSFLGGAVNIYCDEVTPSEYRPGLVGTKVDIETDGVAIFAQMGIEIDEKLTIVNPENAEVSEHDDIYGNSGYTVLNADGEFAKYVTIEPLGYKVTINGLNTGMVAEVPVGVSLNEFYCEFFGIDDFSEVFNTEKEGYTFGGFYTDEACTDGNEFDFDTPITGDVTIYAKWIKNAEDNTGGNAGNDENTQPVPNPEIPNTDATVNNANSNGWFAVMLTLSMGLALVMTKSKKRVFSK